MKKHSMVNLKYPCFLFSYPNLDITSRYQAKPSQAVTLSSQFSTVNHVLKFVILKFYKIKKKEKKKKNIYIYIYIYTWQFPDLKVFSKIYVSRKENVFKSQNNMKLIFLYSQLISTVLLLGSPAVRDNQSNF